MQEKYYVGMDIENQSVGWSVIDEEGNILKFKKKNMWGVRLFDEAHNLEIRKYYRINRRRLKRRKERILLLRELLKEEIDKSFFERLDQSFLHLEDRTDKINKSNLFVGEFTDKDYYKKYPTIYHLRKDLIENQEKKDIRLVYLAIHHIIKYRGNFLDKENKEDILNNEKYISFSKVKSYEKYQKELKILKDIISYYDKDFYKEIFKSKEESIYQSYVKNKYKVIKGKSVKSIFYKKIKDFMKEKLTDDYLIKEKLYIIEEIEKDNFLIKQNTKENTDISYKLNEKELIEILENQGKYHQVIRKNQDKILKILNMRIPYYVGPLNKHSPFAWIEKKKESKIYPWNIQEVIDMDISAERFIKKVTRKCDYLKNEDVLPKNSLLYEEFESYNKKGKKELSSRRDFQKIFKNIDEYNINNKIEKIIEWFTVFGDKEIVKRKINNNYPEIANDDEVMEKILKLEYKGWSNYSRKLIDGISVNYNNRNLTIMDIMRKSNLTFEEIINDKRFGFDEIIKKENKMDKIKKITYENTLKELPYSPQEKRSSWQCIKLIEEISKIRILYPEKIYINNYRNDKFSKNILKILQNSYQGKIEIVEVQKNIVDDFIKENNIYMNRNLNDYYFAKSAYITAALGVFLEKKIVVNDNIINKMKKQLDYKDCNITKRVCENRGELFKETIYPKLTKDKKVSNPIPIKANLDVKKYGYYTGEQTAYFSIIEHQKNNTRVKSLEKVPIRYSNNIGNSREKLKSYFEDIRNLKNVKILKDKVLKYQLFETEKGLFYLISDKEYQNATQLLLDSRCEEILCKMKGELVDDVKCEDLIYVYDCIVYKMENYYKELKNTVKKLQNNKSEFAKLSKKDMIKVIEEMLKITGANNLNGNLSLIKGSIREGRINGRTFDIENTTFIYPSVTGLFMKREKF